MYDIKNVIKKMKQIAGIESNADLARLLDISYNTLNTWIKRYKLPQEVLISFCKQYKCSLDYLLLDINENNTLFNTTKYINIDNKDDNKFIYYGKIDKEKDYNYIELSLDSSILHSNAYYLLNKDNIHIVAICDFDLFNNTVYITTNKITHHKITLDSFMQINKGLIVNTKYIK